MEAIFDRGRRLASRASQRAPLRFCRWQVCAVSAEARKVATRLRAVLVGRRYVLPMRVFRRQNASRQMKASGM